MLELWAKRRPVEGRGYPYEYILSFTDKEQRFYLTDQLDRTVYQECMVTNEDHRLVFYREFEKPYVKVKERKNNEYNR